MAEEDSPGAREGGWRPNFIERIFRIKPGGKPEMTAPAQVLGPDGQGLANTTFTAEMPVHKKVKLPHTNN